jgi:anti-sigma factor RsiW
VDGELPKRQARDFERHIGNCPGCTAFLNTYRVTRSLGRSLPEPRIPKELVERIVKVLCPSKGGHQGKSTEGAAKAGIQNRTAAASRKTRRRAIQGR